jgi:cation:H+ antiporter
VAATLRGQREIAIANVLGSNVFNILGILGVSGTIAPQGLAASPSAVAFDVPVMLAVSFACLPIFFSGHRISRWEGAVFLGYYGAYTGFLLLQASRHAALPVLSGLMLWFVLPLTAITLLVVAAAQIRRGK